MKRHVAYGAFLVLLIAVWISLKISLLNSTPSRLQWFVNVSPFYGLIIFGCYCLARLGLDLMSFNDYPAEIKLLEKVCRSFQMFSTSYITFITGYNCSQERFVE
jgi:dolichyl-phosphate mannosyltransferase polypeptide 3